jgi:WD40 repeat protein
MIQSYLDFRELLLCSQVNKQFRYVFKEYEEVFYRKFLRKMGLVCPPDVSVTSFFRKSWNIRNENHKFILAESNVSYSSKQTEDTSSNSQYLLVWPCSLRFYYLVAYYQNIVCFISGTDATIHSGKIDNGKFIKTKTVNGDQDIIGLLLSNEQGKLLSFDESSNVIIWNMLDMEILGRISCAELLSSIISMNVTGNLMIIGGGNCKVGIWRIDDLSLVALIELDNLEPLNVGVFGDRAVIGLRSGKYLVFKVSTKTQLFEIDIFNSGIKDKIITADSSKNTQAEPAPTSSRGEMDNIWSMVYPESNFNETGLGLGPSEVSMSDLTEIEEFSDGQEIPQNRLPNGIQWHAQEPLLDNESENEDIFDINDPRFDDIFLNLRDQAILGNLHGVVPRTLSIRDNILVTNGPTPLELLLWDLNDGKPLEKLSENASPGRLSDFSPLNEQLKVAEFSSDGSIVFCISGFEVDNRLLVWDYNGDQRTVRIQKITIDEVMLRDFSIWVAVAE